MRYAPVYDGDDEATPFQRPEIMTGYPLDEREKKAIESYLAERDREEQENGPRGT